MIHIVIGTRAQLLKMAPVMRELDARGLEWRWIYTAQHRETVDEIREVFGLRVPDATVFDWSSEAKTLAKAWYWSVRLALSLARGRDLLDGHAGPQHVVLTHGDTMTTLWAAILGRLTRCRVMHVEAGLRSFNYFRPFPEELVRVATSRLSQVHACPGPSAVSNLKGVRGVKLDLGGNTQLDTLRFGLSSSDRATFDPPAAPYVVASIHRAETLFNRDRFIKVIDLIRMVSERFRVLFVMHPSTESRLRELGLMGVLDDADGIDLLPRLGYLDFILALRNSQFAITDGGGNEEELSYLGVPALLMRSESERQDLRKTAVLSKFDEAVVRDFMDNYTGLAMDVTRSTAWPTGVIVDYLEQWHGPDTGGLG